MSFTDPFSIFEVARRQPSALGLVTPRRKYTFNELAERTRAVIEELEAQGIPKGAPVALVARPRIYDVLMLYALMARGNILVPLHPKLTARETLEFTELCSELGGTVSILPSAKTAQRTPLAFPSAPGTQRPPVSRVNLIRSDFIAPRHRDDLLAVLQTSGSSGQAKAAKLTRRAFEAAARASAENLGWLDNDRWLLSLPLAHIGGLSVVTRCLLAGRALALADDEDADPPFADLITHTRPTLLSLVPTQLRRLIDSGFDLPPQVRAILVGGARTSPQLLSKAHALGWPLLTTYGFTEACSQVCTQPYARRFERPIGVGKPLSEIEVRVVDGELQVRGQTLFSGYLPSSENREAFTDDGWFKTGDLGVLDDHGFLHVQGRAKNLIISGGENVSPEEVERVLEGLPGIHAACAFGIADPEWGETVAIAVVAQGGVPVDSRELSKGLAQGLASFKRPRFWAEVEALPLNRTGKTDRFAARQLAAPRLVPLAYPKP